jgi:hypothetical protein
MDKIQSAINIVVNKNPSILQDATGNKAATTSMYRSLKSQNPPLYDSMLVGGQPEDIDSFINKLLVTAESNAAAVLQLKPYGYRYTTLANADSKGGHKRQRDGDTKSEEHKRLRHNNQSSKSSAGENKSFVETCNHCGWKNHKTTECSLARSKDPDINPKANIPWAL